MTSGIFGIEAVPTPTSIDANPVRGGVFKRRSATHAAWAIALRGLKPTPTISLPLCGDGRGLSGEQIRRGAAR
jgi:hypothetical protein